MKVMAINSSPRVWKESKTEIVLDHLVRGKREAGADVDVDPFPYRHARILYTGTPNVGVPDKDDRCPDKKGRIREGSKWTGCP